MVARVSKELVAVVVGDDVVGDRSECEVVQSAPVVEGGWNFELLLCKGDEVL